MRNQVIALAGLWQALDLVHQFSSEGELDGPQRKRFDVAVDSLFMRISSPEDNPAKVFSGIHNLEYAFHALAHQLEQIGKRHQVVSYMVRVLALQKRVQGDHRLTGAIAERLRELEQQHDFFSGKNNEQLIANLADLYLNTLGSMPMHQRIRIYGKGEYLQKEHVQQSIRTLLLAALRAAMLWQQMGGNRLWLIFQRRRILHELYQLSNL